MKKLLLVTTLLSSAVMADDFCLSMYGAGKTVMESRQAGVPMPNMINLVNEAGENVSGLLKEITIEAYSHPIYRTEKMKDKTIIEFANSLYLQCLKQQ